MISSRAPRGPRLAGEGVQHGTLFRSGGPPQLLQVGLGSDEHFAAARHLSLVMSPRGIDIFPLEQEIPHNTDNTASHRGSVAQKALEKYSSRPGPDGQAVAGSSTPARGGASVGLQGLQGFALCLPCGCDPPCLLD